MSSIFQIEEGVLVKYRGKDTKVIIPETVESIGSDAFSNCLKRELISVEKGNAVYHSQGNCLIETARKFFVLGCNNSVIPDDGSVVTIGPYAFDGCEEMEDIIIPNGIEAICESAFSYCGGLTMRGWYRYDTRFGIPVYDEKGELLRYNIFKVRMLVRCDADGKYHKKPRVFCQGFYVQQLQ